MPTAASHTVAFSSPRGLCPRNLQAGQRRAGGDLAARGAGGRQVGWWLAAAPQCSQPWPHGAPPHVMGPQEGEEDGAPHCMEGAEANRVHTSSVALAVLSCAQSMAGNSLSAVASRLRLSAWYSASTAPSRNRTILPTRAGQQTKTETGDCAANGVSVTLQDQISAQQEVT